MTARILFFMNKPLLFALMIGCIFFAAMDTRGEIKTKVVPLRFKYQDGSDLSDTDTGWVTLVPGLTEGKVNIGAGTMPFKLDLSALLFIKYDADEIYSLPNSDHYVPVECWLLAQDDPYRTEISANYGVEVGVSVRNKLFGWPEIPFTKDFRLADSQNAACPLGTNTIGCMDNIEFISVPLPELIGDSAKPLSKLLDGLGNTGVGMASINLVGEIVITGNYIDMVIGDQYVKFLGTGLENKKTVNIRIPKDYVFDQLQLYLHSTYEFDVYQGIGLIFTLIDPLSFTMNPAILSRSHLADGAYQPPDFDDLSTYYIKAASKIPVSDCESVYSYIPMATTPNLPDLSISTFHLQGSEPGMLFANEDTDVQIAIRNNGLRAMDSTGRSYLYVYTNDIQVIRICLRDPSLGITGNNIAPGGVLYTNLSLRLPAGDSVKVSARVSCVEFQAEDNGEDIYGYVDAKESNNSTWGNYEVFENKGWVRGTVHTEPRGLEGNGTHYVSNFVIRLTGNNYVSEQRSDASGAWIFEGIPTGVYELEIVPPADVPPGMARYWARSYEFHHLMGYQENVDVDKKFQATYFPDHFLLQMQSVEGALADPHGTPIRNATVSLGNPAVTSASTEEHGFFSLTNIVPRGEFTLYFSHPEFQTAQTNINMADQVLDTSVSNFIVSTEHDPIILQPDLSTPTIDASFPGSGFFINTDFNISFATFDHEKPTAEWRWVVRSNSVEQATSGWQELSPRTGDDWTNVLVSVAGLADGAHSIFVEARDARGNIGAANTWFTLDTTPPVIGVSIAGGASLITSNSAPVDITLSETFSSPVTIEFSIGDTTCSLPAGQSTLHLPDVPLIFTHEYNGSVTLTATVTDPAGNSGTGSDSIQIDSSEHVRLAAGESYAAAGDVPVSYNWPSAASETIYSEPPIGTYIPVSNLLMRAQRFVLSGSATVNEIRTTAQPQGSPGPLYVYLTDALSLDAPHVLTSRFINDSEGDLSTTWFLMPDTVSLSSGVNYYFIVACPTATGSNDWWNFTAGISCYGGSGQPRYDYIGTQWVLADGDAEAETGCSNAFYQVPFDLGHRSIGQARWSLDSETYSSQPWAALTSAPETLNLTTAGEHTFWVQYTNVLSHEGHLYRDSVQIDNTPPQLQAVLQEYNDASHQFHVKIEVSDADSGPSGTLSYRMGSSDGWHLVSPVPRDLTLSRPADAFSTIDFLFYDRVFNHAMSSIYISSLGDIFPPTLNMQINENNPYTEDPEKINLRFDMQNNDEVEGIILEYPNLAVQTISPPVETFDAKLPPSPGLKEPLDGTYTYRAWDFDHSGNTSAVAQASITLDRHDPSIDSLRLADRNGFNPFTMENAFSFLLRASDECSPVEYRYSDNNGHSWSDWASVPDTRTVLEGLNPSAFQYTLDVEVRDALEHTVSASATIPHIRAPAAPALSGPDDYTFTGTNTIHLRGDSFSDPDPGDHLGGAFWIVTSESGEKTYFSGTTNDISFAPYLGFGTYSWQVRYIDSYGLLSDWSDVRHFAIGTADTDSDEDDLPDWYEYDQFHSYNQTGVGDTDGDGHSNLDEYIAGTDPGDPFSLFSAELARTDSECILNWPTAEDRTYAVLWTESLDRGFRYLECALPWPACCYTDAVHSAHSQGFYKLAVRLPSDDDADADGLPDNWELKLFGSIAACDPMDDPDGDRYSNMSEYLLHTDPTNRVSVFTMTQQLLPNGHVAIHWSPISEKQIYTILWTPALGSPFRILKKNIPYPENCWTDTVHSAFSTGFYQIDIQ